MCSVFAFSQPAKEEVSVLDKRPHLKCDLEGIEINCLVDTGASVSVISSSVFRRLPNHWTLQKLPIPPGFRLSGASGSVLQLVGCYQLRMRVLGREIERPFYVISGLSKAQAILGIDFIKEQQMVISPDNVFFQNLSPRDVYKCSSICVLEDISIPARSVNRRSFAVRSATGQTLRPGITGICSSSSDTLGVWDTCGKTDNEGNVVTVITNITDEDLFMKKGTVVGHFNPLTSSDLKASRTEESIDAIFSDFSREPKEPYTGPAREPLTDKDRQFIEDNLKIKAPTDFYERYKDLCYKYHDVFSKSKFDLGWTDVVEHKVNMKNEDPIHVRQFRIPLEHRQTIYDWVDELLSKGAIEVSRSCFNTPIFLVPKPHGHGMRAVLDFRQINTASIPDRYTIREVRDCVDEIGMSGSDIFTTIDLTSGFWQQSLERGSRKYTAFTVPGKGTRYQWTVTPMGLQGSPASFARLIDYTMRGLQGVLTYIDDILVHSRGHLSHLESVEKVFLRLRKYGLKLNVAKSTFGASEVCYLGYLIDKNGLRPGSEKLDAVKKLEAPTSVKKIREFVGLANYFRFLIPHFALFSGVLTNLTKKNSGYVDGPLPAKAIEAFNYLKNALVNEPIVSHPRPGFTYHLSTDACAGDDSGKMVTRELLLTRVVP